MLNRSESCSIVHIIWIVFFLSVRTGPWKCGKSWIWKFCFHAWNFCIDPGIWTYQSIFLMISVQEFSRYTSSEMLSLATTYCTLLTYSFVLFQCLVHCSAAFIENICIFLHITVCEFIQTVLEFEMAKCLWTLCYSDWPTSVNILDEK